MQLCVLAFLRALGRERIANKFDAAMATPRKGADDDDGAVSARASAGAPVPTIPTTTMLPPGSSWLTEDTINALAAQLLRRVAILADAVRRIAARTPALPVAAAAEVSDASATTGTGALPGAPRDAPAPADAPDAPPDGEAPADTGCGVLRCLNAYATFKREHGVVDGAYYIVHNGVVLNEPLRSRDEALELLHAIESDGGTVKLGGLGGDGGGKRVGGEGCSHAPVAL